MVVGWHSALIRAGIVGSFGAVSGWSPVFNNSIHSHDVLDTRNAAVFCSEVHLTRSRFFVQNFANLGMVSYCLWDHPLYPRVKLISGALPLKALGDNPSFEDQRVILKGRQGLATRLTDNNGEE